MQADVYRISLSDKDFTVRITPFVCAHYTKTGTTLLWDVSVCIA